MTGHERRRNRTKTNRDHAVAVAVVVLASECPRAILSSAQLIEMNRVVVIVPSRLRNAPIRTRRLRAVVADRAETNHRPAVMTEPVHDAVVRGQIVTTSTRVIDPLMVARTASPMDSMPR